MSHLDRQVTIACPLGQAAKRIDDFLQTHGNRSEEAVTFTLSANAVASDPSTLRVERSAIVTVAPFDRRTDIEPHYRVHWYPQIPGQVPVFSGEMFVKCDEDDTSFSLIVRGGYTLPLGAMGAAYDLVVGAHVARATASDLLSRIRNFIEDAERSGERFGHVPARSATLVRAVAPSLAT